MDKMTVEQVKKLLPEITDEQDPLFQQLAVDSRKGVQTLVAKWRREKQKALLERKRYENMSKLEEEARAAGYEHIAGVDEAGRGPLAGPVVSAAVILPADCYIAGINDSKQLSEKNALTFIKKLRKKQSLSELGLFRRGK